MKRIFFCILAIIANFSFITEGAIVIDGLEFTIDQSSKVATLVECDVEGKVIIPSMINFNEESYIVKYIGTGGSSPSPIFSKATKVVIPPTVEYIRGGVFSRCSSINEIIFEDGDKGLTIVGREDSYGPGAFYLCENLKSLYVGRPFIKTNLFYQTNLAGPIKVEIGPNVKYINGFSEAPIDPEIDLSGIEEIGKRAFEDTKISELELPNIVNIGDYAFANCPITRLKLGNKSKEIGEFAFYGTQLTELTLPSSLEKIGKQSFNIKSIDTIIIEDSPESLIIDDAGMFSEVPFKKLYLGRDIFSKSINEYTGPFGRTEYPKYYFPPIEVEFGKNVTRINQSMFSDRSFLGELILPDSIENIMRYAFAKGERNTNEVKSEIELVKLPKALKESGFQPFKGRIIKDVEVPDGINYLSGDLFPGRPSKIRIPSSVDIVEHHSAFMADSIFIEDRETELDLYGVGFGANYLYCGASITWGYNEITCKKFEIGDKVTSLYGVNLSVNGDNPLIISNTLQPPVFYNVDNDTYEKSKVIIEFNSKDRYRASTTWNKFPVLEYFVSFPFDNIEIFLNESIEIEGKINENFADDNSLEWSSSNTEVAKVENGMVYGYGIGNRCLITAKDKYNHSATCVVKVKPILVQSLMIDPSELSVDEGAEFEISVTILPENATNKTLTWSSSDERLATVNDNGLVTILKEGNCVITARTTDGSDLTAECHISITTGIEDIFMDGLEKVDLITLEGIVVKEGLSKADFHNLERGVYILRKSNKIKRLIIR